MREVVVVSPLRTPVGVFGGSLSGIKAEDLAAHIFRAVLDRTGVDPAILDDVILGCVAQPYDAANIARVAALKAGVPFHVPGFTIQRNCASGIQVITSAYQAIQAGDGEIFLVGGSESMSNVPYTLKKARWGLRLRHAELSDGLWDALTDPVAGLIMGLTAENLVEKYNITREEMDRYAVESHRRAAAAQAAGKFKDEIVPVEVTQRVRGQKVKKAVDADEGIRPDLTLEKAAQYPPVFKKGGTVTAANACPINDGAAAMLVMTAEKAAELGLKPMARVVGYAYAGVDPAYMGIGPAYSIPKVLKKTGLKLDDIGIIELNEAFAAQIIADDIELKRQGYELDFEKVNPNGGAIALGHPVGATGSKLTATLLYEMHRSGIRYGMVTMCVGGGQGGAMIFEKV